MKVILGVKDPDVKLQDAGSGKVETGALLLRSVHAWYLAPLFAGTVVWSGTLISVGLASTPMPRALLVLTLSASAAVVALPFWLGGSAVWRLNQSAVRAYLQPYTKELRALLDEIPSEQGGRQPMTAPHSYHLHAKWHLVAAALTANNNNVDKHGRGTHEDTGPAMCGGRSHGSITCGLLSRGSLSLAYSWRE